MTINKSQINRLKYDRWKNEARLITPKWHDVDDGITRLCKEYTKISDEERKEIRDAINDDATYVLWTYCMRMSVFAIREKKAEYLTNALIALAMISTNKIDFRDWFVISVPVYAANKIGVNSDQLLQEASALADENTAKILRAEIGKEPRLQLLEEIQTREGVGLMSSYGGAIRSKYDLKQAAVALMEIIEKEGKYFVDEISTHNTLAKIWLAGGDDQTLDEAIRGIKTGIQVSSRLRPEFRRANETQVLWVNLYEVTDELFAKSICRISTKIKPKGYSLFALHENQLLCVVIARSLEYIGVPYETMKSIERYRDRITKTVRKFAGVSS